MQRTPEQDRGWKLWRREGVTATDVANAVAGTYGGIYGVVVRKLGLEVVEQTTEMQRGHDWQPVIADAVHALTGRYVVGEETWCEHADEPRWRATVDGFLAPMPEARPDDLTAVLEVKTVGIGARPDRSRWATQMQWQMFVTGMPRALLAEARIDDDAGECRGVRLEWVEADPDLHNYLVDVAERIFEHVQAGTLPDPDSPSALDVVKAVHARSTPDAPTLPLDDLADELRRFSEIKAAVKAVTDEKDLLEARIREAMGEAVKGTAPGFRVSVSNPAKVLTAEAEAELFETHPEYARPALDRDRVKAENPELYESFRKPVGARRLTVTPLEDK